MTSIEKQPASSPNAPGDVEEPTTVDDLIGSKRTVGQHIHEILHRQPALSPLIVLVLALIVFNFLSDRFIRLENLSLVVQQVAGVACLAAGQTLIILTAGIDLSIGFIAVITTLVTCKLVADQGLPSVLALIIGLVVAVAASTFNGLLVTWIKLPPFIVTLGTLSIWTAISLIYAKGQTVLFTDPTHTPFLLWTGNSHQLGSFAITNGVILMLVLFAVLAFVLRFTGWGRHLYATGDDTEAARLAGIRTDRVILSAYAVAGVAMAVGAWVLIGRVGGADPNGGLNLNLQSITAVVIGGTSLFGGRGLVVGSLIGALIVQVFSNGLQLAGYDQQWQVFATGVLVIVAVSVDQWIRKVKS